MIIEDIFGKKKFIGRYYSAGSPPGRGMCIKTKDGREIPVETLEKVAEALHRIADLRMRKKSRFYDNMFEEIKKERERDQTGLAWEYGWQLIHEYKQSGKKGDHRYQRKYRAGKKIVRLIEDGVDLTLDDAIEIDLISDERPLVGEWRKPDIFPVDLKKYKN